MSAASALLASGSSTWSRPPGQWVSHVSRPLRVPPPARDADLRLLAGVPAAHGAFVAARTYDTRTRSVTSV